MTSPAPSPAAAAAEATAAAAATNAELATIARRQALIPLAAGIALLALVAICFASLRGDWAGLFSRDAASKMGELVGELVQLNTSPDFLRKVAFATLETLAMSWLGTLLALLAALALAVPAAHPHWQIRAPARAALNALRAVPELVWASLLVIAAGLGPFTGTLALALHTAGVLGRLLADALENTSSEPAATLRGNGATGLQAFAYATLPGVLPQAVAYTLYRWENNIRAASVLGVVGAGGLGQMLAYHLGLLQYGDAATVLLALIALVAVVDGVSHGLRRALG